jgi:hypothetical protein
MGMDGSGLPWLPLPLSITEIFDWYDVVSGLTEMGEFR